MSSRFESCPAHRPSVAGRSLRPLMRVIVVQGERGATWLADVPTRRCERMRGLIGWSCLEPGRGLLLTRARSVHTFGMRFAVTVAQLDEDLRILAVRTLRPRRLLLPRPNVRHVLECASGSDVRPGDVLTLGEQGPQDEEDQGGGDPQDHEQRGNQPPRPRGERHGLTPSGLGLHDPEELQQRPHTSPSARGLVLEAGSRPSVGAGYTAGCTRGRGAASARAPIV